MSEESSGATESAAKGAAAGALLGPVGAVVGGIIGGIVGFFGGQKHREARLKREAVNRITLAEAEQQQAITRRDLIRQSRVQYATTLAQASSDQGEITTSGVQGIKSSELSQTYFNLGFLDKTAQQAVDKFNLTGDANKLDAKGNEISGYLSAATSLVGTFAGAFPGGGSKPAGNAGQVTGGHYYDFSATSASAYRSNNPLGLSGKGALGSSSNGFGFSGGGVLNFNRAPGT